ncbi:MAG: hypothetical protein ACRDT1_13780 [Micromonosporaceae bacterium]
MGRAGGMRRWLLPLLWILPWLGVLPGLPGIRHGRRRLTVRGRRALMRALGLMW